MSNTIPDKNFLDSKDFFIYKNKSKQSLFYFVYPLVITFIWILVFGIVLSQNQKLCGDTILWNHTKLNFWLLIVLGMIQICTLVIETNVTVKENLHLFLKAVCLLSNLSVAVFIFVGCFACLRFLKYEPRHLDCNSINEMLFLYMIITVILFILSLIPGLINLVRNKNEGGIESKQLKKEHTD